MMSSLGVTMVQHSLERCMRHFKTTFWIFFQNKGFIENFTDYSRRQRVFAKGVGDLYRGEGQISYRDLVHCHKKY